MSKIGNFLKESYGGLARDYASVGKRIYENFVPAGVQKRNVDKTIAAQRELAEYGYSKDLEMWERANAYNSPEAQMARLREAGLNPNLVYGSGSAAGNTATQTPRYQAPNVQYDYRAPVDLGSIIGLYQNVQMRGAQIDQVKAQTRLTNAAAVQRDEENRFGLGSYRATKMREDSFRSGYQGKLLSGMSMYSDQFGSEELRKRMIDNELRESEQLFKRYRNEWMRAGVTTSDHPALRMLIRGWNNPDVMNFFNRQWTDK